MLSEAQLAGVQNPDPLVQIGLLIITPTSTLIVLLNPIGESSSTGRACEQCEEGRMSATPGAAACKKCTSGSPVTLNITHELQTHVNFVFRGSVLSLNASAGLQASFKPQ